MPYSKRTMRSIRPGFGNATGTATKGSDSSCLGVASSSTRTQRESLRPTERAAPVKKV